MRPHLEGQVRRHSGGSRYKYTGTRQLRFIHRPARLDSDADFVGILPRVQRVHRVRSRRAVAQRHVDAARYRPPLHILQGARTSFARIRIDTYRSSYVRRSRPERQRHRAVQRRLPFRSCRFRTLRTTG